MANIINDYEYNYDIPKMKEFLTFLNLKLNNKKNYTIVFMNNEEIKTINLEFRKIDKATDVLSFEEDLEDYLGDILISIDKMKDQAYEYEHSEEQELYFLIMHGFLHLNGYTHDDKKEEQKMIQLQKEIVNEFAIRR